MSRARRDYHHYARACLFFSSRRGHTRWNCDWSSDMCSSDLFDPGQPDWLDKLDAGLALKPDSCKGYTIGDNTHKDISRYPWRMDDEKVAYKGYEKMVQAGIKNVCIHKGLFAPGIEKQFPHLRGFADVADVGRAAKDWPQLNFIIYHSAYRHVGGDPKQALAEFERTRALSRARHP